MPHNKMPSNTHRERLDTIICLLAFFLLNCDTGLKIQDYGDEAKKSIFVLSIRSGHGNKKKQKILFHKTVRAAP
jgi:hypothetical protein